MIVYQKKNVNMLRCWRVCKSKRTTWQTSLRMSWRRWEWHGEGKSEIQSHVLVSSTIPSYISLNKQRQVTVDVDVAHLCTKHNPRCIESSKRKVTVDVSDFSILIIFVRPCTKLICLQVYEFESSKRNNLIFYGLASEEGEVTKQELQHVAKDFVAIYSRIVGNW